MWIEIKSEADLPPEGKYVLARHTRKTWHDSTDQENVNCVVVKLVKGISKEERELLRMIDSPRAALYMPADEDGNNLVPYYWRQFGYDNFFGQEISRWKPIEPPQTLTMKAIHKKRLLKLYEYMQQPQSKLAHKKFAFNCFNEGFTSPNTCGTIGCMAGELPAIFPRSWRWERNGIVRRPGEYTPRELREFFGLTLDECLHLFYPTPQRSSIDPYYERHPVLFSKATKRQVVANLRRFLKIKGIL